MQRTMKLLIKVLTAAFTIATSSLHAQSLPIIPKPVTVSIQKGHFILTEDTAIRFPNHLKNDNAVRYILFLAFGERKLLRENSPHTIGKKMNILGK